MDGCVGNEDVVWLFSMASGAQVKDGCTELAGAAECGGQWSSLSGQPWPVVGDGPFFAVAMGRNRSMMPVHFFGWP